MQSHPSPRASFSRLLICVIGASFFAAKISLAADVLTYLRDINLDHPHCEARVNLEIGHEYFVEIANDLPGRTEYNDLIRLYNKRDWPNFDAKLTAFRVIFEASALQEAAAYLLVQSKFERLKKGDEGELLEAERLLRELLRLYPNSSLAPVISATVASFWLRSDLFERSLALYEVARKQYAEHPLACVFLMGTAENNYLLRNFKEANSLFNNIIEKCENVRLKTGAFMRLADIEAVTETAHETNYEKAYNFNPPQIRKFYPATLANLGELKYKSKQFPTARFYFNEYLKQDGREVRCAAYALKRLADISFRTRAPLEGVVGQYLIVKDKYPLNDVGRFSHIHGLLLELNKMNEPERKRRYKVVDEEIGKIKDEPLRDLAYLEKGLLLLSGGEKQALDYLVRLNERTQFNLEKGPISDFVREKLLDILDEESLKTADRKRNRKTGKKPEYKDPSGRDIFDSVEQAYDLWLKSSSFEEKGRKLYGKILLKKFEDAFEAGEHEEGLKLLTRWTASKLWPKEGPSKEMRVKMASRLIRSMMESEETEDLALQYLKNDKGIRPFVDPEFNQFWLITALLENNDEAVKLYFKAGKNSAPKAAPAGTPADVQAYLWLMAGEGYLKIKKYADAEKAFLKVRDPELFKEAQTSLLGLYKEIKDYNKAYRAVELLLQKSTPEEKKENMQFLFSVVQDGRFWKKAPDLVKLAKQAGISGKELAPYFYLSGRAHFELDQCKLSIESYEQGLVLDNTTTAASEGRFRLGKCLAQERKMAQARAIWEELVKIKDAFWSPLALNEIKLLQ